MITEICEQNDVQWRCCLCLFYFIVVVVAVVVVGCSVDVIFVAVLYYAHD